MVSVLLVPDLHSPYHDESAVNALCAVAQALKPDFGVFLGDNWDCPQFSKFRKDPRTRMGASHEVDIAKRIVKQVHDSAPKRTTWQAVEGNHDHRVRDWMWDHAPELWSIMQEGADTDYLLGYSALGVGFHEHDVTIKAGRSELFCLHGDYVRKWAGMSAHAHIESEGMTLAHGHCHRLALYPRSFRNRVVWGAECGCLCRMDQQYLKGKPPNWQQGFAVAWLDEERAAVSFDLVPIVAGRAYWQGKAYKG
jgi:predicted phosphodiesterase